MKIGILGGRGYLGASLQNAIVGEGTSFILLPREFNPRHVSSNIDLVIDAGFPRDIHNRRVYEEYFKNLTKRIKYYRALKIPYIYFGSLSSHSTTMSRYGLAKREAERLVLSQGGKVIRFGLIVDTKKSGGRYLELLEVFNKMPFLFLPHPSYFPIGITTLDEFISRVKCLLVEKETVVNNFMAPVEWTNLNSLARKSTNKKIITIPAVFTLAICKIIRVLPLGKIDNLKGIAFKALS